MSRRAGVAAVPMALTFVSLLLAGCTPVVERAVVRPFLVPQDLSYQYVTGCMGDDLGAGDIIRFHYGDGASVVTFDQDTPETRAAAERIQNCLDRYEMEQPSDSFTFISAYERAQLWDFYTSVTVPCLAAQGIALDPVARSTFFAPDRRPWNPYTSMEGVPFDDLVDLYRACPPTPVYLDARHEP